ncbi:hypothetical protein P8T57_05480 [Thalassospira sp. SN3W]|uniref:hypothetical protein n=1 Tax=Thalassospira sp. SN3W TaxID=3035476 RepID=UPI00311B23A1
MSETGAKKDQDPDDLPNDNLDDELDDRLDHLARQFMDLWREQVAATADGADAASAIGRLYASLGADTSRIGEGFEAWGKLIGQLATGQKPGAFPGALSGPVPGGVPGMMSGMIPGMTPETLPEMMKGTPMDPAANPMAAMIHQMSKMAMPGMTGTTSKANVDKKADPGTTVKEAGKAEATKGKTGKSNKSGQGKNERAKPTADKPAEKGKQSSRRAKAAGDASGSRDDELVELARRLADLQETISALEAGTAGSGEEAPERDGKPLS